MPRATRRLVVIGNGMAAMRTVEELLELAPQAYEITVFGAEPQGGYNRVLLSPLLAGEKQLEEIVTHPPEWYRERGISLHRGDPVVHIDRGRRRVRSRSGIEAHYDRLLIATGSRFRASAVPGKRAARRVIAFAICRTSTTMLEAARRASAVPW